MNKTNVWCSPGADVINGLQQLNRENTAEIPNSAANVSQYRLISGATGISAVFALLNCCKLLKDPGPGCREYNTDYDAAEQCKNCRKI